MAEYPIYTKEWLQKTLDNPEVLGERFYNDEVQKLLNVLLEGIEGDSIIPDSETLAKLISIIQRFVTGTKLGAVANVMEIWLNEKKPQKLHEWDGIHN